MSYHNRDGVRINQGNDNNLLSKIIAIAYRRKWGEKKRRNFLLGGVWPFLILQVKYGELKAAQYGDLRQS